jgi:hypothetical protein
MAHTIPNKHFSQKINDVNTVRFMSQDDLKGNVESQKSTSQHTEQVKFAQAVKDNNKNATKQPTAD